MPIGQRKRKTIPEIKPPKEKTRYDVISQCIGTLAGLDYQLGSATHFTDIAERIGWLQLHAPPDLPREDAETLENLRLWVERARKIIAQFRAKLETMHGPLDAASHAIRLRGGADYGPR